jgi:F1F0 ATPase subunit 2
MTMREILFLAASTAAGAALGAAFFGGLWLTVRKGVSSQQPALLFMSSLLLRMSVALLGFYVVSGGHWERLLACLVGFTAARVIMTRMTELNASGAGETSRAS